MMKQAQAEMEKMKKDPEMKEIMKQMEKMNQPSSTAKSSSSSSSSKNNGHLINLSPSKIPTKAQATDNLFWYKGKKLNDSIMVMPTGLVIKYTKKSQEIKVQLPTKSAFNKINAELEKTEKRKDAFIETMAKSRIGYFSYPFVKQGLDAMDEVDKGLKSIAVNSMPLPSIPAAENTKTVKGGMGNENADDAPQWVVSDAAAVMAFAQSHEHDSWVYVSPPPLRDFDYCQVCDKDKRDEANKKDSLYRDAFDKEERELLAKAIRIQRFYETTGHPPAVEKYDAQMSAAISIIIRYEKLKTEVLVKQYANDFQRLAMVASIAIGLEHQLQLMGIDAGLSTDEILARLAKGMDQLDGYVDKLISERDYRQLMNWGWIVGIYRQRELLGIGTDSTQDKTTPLGAMVTKLENFNRYKLTIDGSSRLVVERDDKGVIKATAEGRLKGEEYYTIYPDTNCLLRLINNKRAEFKGEAMDQQQAMEAAQFKMKVVQAKSDNATYVSPNEWMTITPFLKMNFCKTIDTVVIYGFSPKMTETEKWNFPKEGVQHASYLFDAFEQGFPVHDIEQEATADMNENEMIKSLTSNFSANPTLHDMELKNRVMTLETQAFSAQHTGGIYLTGDTSNGAIVFFKSEIDGKQNNSNPDVLAAQLKVLIEHSPLK